MTVYMVVEANEYSLPVGVFDTIADVANFLSICPRAVRYGVKYHRRMTKRFYVEKIAL